MEPMTADEALKFMFDTPLMPFTPYLCNGCDALVRKGNRKRHADAEHPGWLEQWNQAIGAV